MANWCYTLCDGVILPAAAIVAFVWTMYQEYRHQRIEKEKKNNWDLVF